MVKVCLQTNIVKPVYIYSIYSNMDTLNTRVHHNSHMYEHLHIHTNNMIYNKM